MHANHPEMAKRWEKETPPDAKLPERVSPRSAVSRRRGPVESRIQQIAKQLRNG